MEAEIKFSGGRAGDWPLTWGQRSTRRWIRWLGPRETSLNIPYVLRVDGDHELPEVLACLRALIERYEALRTCFPETPGGPRQRVAGAGTLCVAVHDHAGEPARPAAAAEVAAAAEELAAELAATPFRHDTELPLRAAVLRIGGRPRAMALAISHLAVDWAALLLLEREWIRLLRDGSDPGEDDEAGTWQPGDQALAEQHGPVAEAGAAALAHWRAALWRIPRSLVDFPAGPPEADRYVRLAMESSAAALAAARLATRWQTSTTTVLAVATTMIVAALTGHQTVPVRMVTGNRREPPLRDLVGKVAQDGLLVLEAARPTFAEVIRHSGDRIKAAYRSSRCDPEVVDRLRTRAGHERGASMDLLLFFNDFRYDRSWSDPSVPVEPAALAPRTTVGLDFTTDRAHAKLFFTVEPASDTCRLCLLMDTAYVARETGETLLRGVERLLLASLAADVPMADVARVAGIAPARRPAGWVRIGPDWIDPDATGDLLRRAAPARHVAIDFSGPASGAAGSRCPGLTAYLVPDDPELRVREVHTRVMAALVDRTDVLAPARYVLCATPPVDVDDLDQWRGRPRLADGDGRTPESEQVYGPLPPEGP